jgi:CheY-like chemotaxis protein
MTAMPLDSRVSVESPGGTAIGGPHVLLVDDESVVSRSVAKLIERLGYRVTVVESGALALDAVRRIPFDIVLTDQHMPAMSGAELIAALVNHAGIGCERIILTSGDIASTETQALVAKARCRYLEKPFHIHELAQTLRSIAPPERAARTA